MEKMKLKAAILNKRIEEIDINPLTGALSLQSTLRMRIPGGTKGKDIQTGIAIEIPEGYYGLIMDSDQMRARYPLHIMTTTITSEHRGEIILNVTNYTSYPETIELKQVIGKIIFLPIQDVDLKMVKSIKQIKPTEE